MKRKKILAVPLAVLLLAMGAGCARTTPPPSSAPALSEPPVQAASESGEESPQPPLPGTKSETYKFTDSAGREVELPENIERIAPSGPLAQVVLYTLCPDKLVGFASGISDKQFEYIDKKYQSLPVFGNFYADTLNLESVLAAAPQVVIDIGEPKQTILEDMEGIQEKTGIPAIFIQMEMDSMASAYKMLGEITGETGQAQKLADYIEKTQSETMQKVSLIPEADRLKVYYGQDEGLTAVVRGNAHAAVIEIAGALNVAEVEKTARGGASEISMEQLMLWNPDVVLFAPGSIYDSVAARPEWAEITAIKNGAYFEVPDGPYNWMGFPPSVNRVLGIRWLSNLLYPDVFQYDMVKETQEFYELFYHCGVTEEEVRALLEKSTYK